MIVTVTLNPLVERRYEFEGVSFPGTNRDGRLSLRVGGKGLNVSRQLNHLNTANLAFTFLGGMNGKLIRELLEKEGINFTSVKTDAETRECAVIIDRKNKQVTSLFGASPEITPHEVEEFKEKLEKIIQNCAIVIFSGSSPCKITNSIIPDGIKLANRYDKISVCDTYGNHLTDCISASPTIIHNNIYELEGSLGIKLNSQSKILEFLDRLYSAGIKQSYLTNEEKTFYASNFDFHFKVKPPAVKAVDSTGSGDSFLSGIVYGWQNDLTFEEGLKLATSLGAVNAARYEVCNISINDADEVMPGVEITAVGKKMKTLDVSPR